MYSNLMVTGGNSLILGFTERLNHDLAHKCPPTVKLRVQAAVTPSERKFGAWIGGSILGSLVSLTFILNSHPFALFLNNNSGFIPTNVGLTGRI